MRLSRLLLAGLLVGIVGLLSAAQPPAEAKDQKVVGKRLGLLHETGAKPKLKIHWKLNTPPASPPTCDHFAGWTWNMGGNDQYGSCAPTSAANHLGMTRKYLLGADKPVPLTQVLDLYKRSSSPPFNPQTGANDNGCVMSDLLDAMAAGGLDGDKVVAFASFADKSDASIQAAINEFGGVLFAVDLQTAQQSQTDAGYWDYRRSSAWGGHAILAGKYDKATGRIDVITWQKDVYTTPAFRRYQLSEVWMPVWKSAVDSGKFFANIDANQFVADYKALTGEDFPVPIKPPPPPPAGTGLTGVETLTYNDGRLVNRTFTPGNAPAGVPNVDRDTHVVDLSHILIERRKERVRTRVLALVADNDHADVRTDGDKIILTRKAGVDWNGFMQFLQGLLPLIEAIIKIFGGL